MKFKMIKPFYSIIISVFFCCVSSAIAMMLLFGDALILTLIAMAIVLPMSPSLIDHYLIKSIRICENGVTYISLRKHYFMKWEDIKIVGLGYMPIKRSGASSWIYFATDGVSFPVLYGRKAEEGFLMIMYRKKVEKTIRLYWKGSIDGLDSISNFEKHLKPKRRLT